MKKLFINTGEERFRDFDGQLFVNAFLGGNTKLSKQVQFII
jgi:hypothetical protein